MRQFVITKSFTPRDYQSLGKYFSEIDKIDLIDPEEEAMLTRRVREGDQQALERLTKTNLRFVVSVAKQYQCQGMTLGDLINEGDLGLITAAKRYDETKGFKFISYAVWWIRHFIIQAIATQSRMVRLPYNKISRLNKINKAFSKLEQLYNRKPTAEELAEFLAISVESVWDLLEKSRPDLSLDQPLGQDGEQAIIDILPDTGSETDDQVMYDSIIKEIEYSLQSLTKKERDVLILFFGLSSLQAMSFEEIGKKLNFSAVYARRLKNEALCKLRNCCHTPALMACLS